MVKKISAVLMGAVLIILTSIFGSSYSLGVYDVEPLSRESLLRSGIDSCDKLIITAHPDDEILWAGGHLMDGGYYILVLTNGNNEERSSEFRKVLKASGSRGIILSYPDKTFGERDDWSQVRDGITRDIETVLTCKKWKTVTTHNEIGEYRHIHHVMTHDIVGEVFREKLGCSGTELYSFGKYYKKDDLPDDGIERMSDDRIAFKEKLLRIYDSQSRTIGKLSHMNPYENWTLEQQ